MRPDIVLTFARYELRRAIARKKVLTLVLLTMVIDTIPYYALAGTRLSLVPVPLHPYLWIVGVFVPQAFFLQFIALLIAAGSMSEEYEQGTAEVSSKPVGRNEYLVGKYLGGYLLMVSVILLNAFLSVVSATYVFGPQEGVGTILPYVLVAQAFSSIVFFSSAFMVGELVRRSSLSYIISSAVFFGSQIIGIYLNVLYNITGTVLYQQADLFLPTSPVDSLPLLLAGPNLPSLAGPLFRFAGIGAVESSATFSALLIAVYAISAVAIAVAYFGRADVAKRVT